MIPPNPSKVTKELAEFIGYYVSEGYIRGDETVVFTNSEKYLLDRFSELTSLVFGLHSKLELQADKTPNVSVHSPVLVKFLDSLEVGRTASTKQIPNILLKSSQGILNAFLEAYFIGDGSFSNGEVGLSTASFQLRNQLSYLLTRLGVIHTLGTRTIGEKTYYRIFVRSIVNLKEFSSIFSKNLTKISSIAKYVNSKRRGFDSIDIAPVSKEYMAEMYRNTTYSKLLKNGICLVDAVLPTSSESKNFTSTELCTETFGVLSACSSTTACEMVRCRCYNIYRMWRERKRTIGYL